MQNFYCVHRKKPQSYTVIVHGRFHQNILEFFFYVNFVGVEYAGAWVCVGKVLNTSISFSQGLRRSHFWLLYLLNKCFCFFQVEHYLH
jgi:hypothetical protein